MGIQTFGDYARWHPHIHVLLADGLFRENGVFYVMPKVDIKPLAELYRASVLKMLKKEGKIDEVLIKKLLTWRHNSGFSVHIIRNPFSVKKITYNDKTGTVIYKSKKTPSKSKGGRKNFKVFSALEFIAAITQQIPEKSFQLVRYYGWYSNRSRGDREKRTENTQPSPPEKTDDLKIIDVSEYKPKKIPSPTWRECIKKVWEVDPLSCPKCGSEMQILSFITENEVIRKILEHLGVWDDSSSRKSPGVRAPPEVIREKRYESYDDGWPCTEEPCVMVR